MRPRALFEGVRCGQLMFVAIAATVSWPQIAWTSPLDAYVGVSVGQSTVKADPLALNKHDLGWKLEVGR